MKRNETKDIVHFSENHSKQLTLCHYLYVYKPIARVDVDHIAFSSSLFSDKVNNTDGLNQLQMDAFGCMVQGSFLTHMYSVGRHSRRSSSSRNRTGKPYAAHLARLDILLIYLPTQVQLTLRKSLKLFPPDTIKQSAL